MLRVFTLLLVFVFVFVVGVSSASAAEPAGVKLGGAMLYPALNYSLQHDDNITSAETNRIKSWISVINPGLLLEAKSGANVYGLTYDLVRGQYHSSKNDNYTDHLISLMAHVEPSSRLYSDINIYHNRTHDPRGSTFSGTAAAAAQVAPDKWHETSGDLLIGIGSMQSMMRVELMGSYGNKRYDTNRAVTASRDLNTFTGGGTFFFQVKPKTSLLLEAKYKRFDYLLKLPDLDSNDQYYYAGITWEATAKTTGTIKLGAQRKNFKDTAKSDFSGFGWEANIDWEPLSYSTVSLGTSSLPNETDGTGSYIKSRDVNMQWNHEWSSRVSHDLHGSYTRNTYVGATRRDTLTAVGLMLNYELQRWLTAGAGYDYSRRTSNAANSSYKRNVFIVNLSAAL